MYLEKLIKKLNECNSLNEWQKRNVKTNIEICKMQIKIRDKGKKKTRRGYG